MAAGRSRETRVVSVREAPLESKSGGVFPCEGGAPTRPRSLRSLGGDERKHTGELADVPPEGAPLLRCLCAAGRPEARGHSDGCGDRRQVDRVAIECKALTAPALQRPACPHAVKPLAVLGGRLLRCALIAPSPDPGQDANAICGRYTLTATPSSVAEHFEVPELPNWPPRYNITPTQHAPVVRAGQGRRELALLRWGLIPSWAKDSAIGARMINARAESLAEKPAFRRAWKERRALVPTDGFYGWRREGKRRQPYYIRRQDGASFALAGLWERWQGPILHLQANFSR